MRDLVTFTAASAMTAELCLSLAIVSPTGNLLFGEHVFSYSGPAAWNSLHDYLQNTTYTKRLLKTYLFSEAA